MKTAQACFTLHVAANVAVGAPETWHSSGQGIQTCKAYKLPAVTGTGKYTPCKTITHIHTQTHMAQTHRTFKYTWYVNPSEWQQTTELFSSRGLSQHAVELPVEQL